LTLPVASPLGEEEGASRYLGFGKKGERRSPASFFPDRLKEGVRVLLLTRKGRSMNCKMFTLTSTGRKGKAEGRMQICSPYFSGREGPKALKKNPASADTRKGPTCRSLGEVPQGLSNQRGEKKARLSPGATAKKGGRRAELGWCLLILGGEKRSAPSTRGGTEGRFSELL